MSTYRSIFENESSAGALADKLDNDFSELWDSTTGLNLYKANIDGSNIDINAFNSALNPEVTTNQTFYINTDAVTNGDGSVGSPWNQFTGFADWIQNKIIPTDTVTIAITVTGITPLRISLDDQIKCQSAKIPNNYASSSITITGELTKLCDVTSVTRDVTYPNKYVVLSPNFNTASNAYRYLFIKSGTSYYPLMASGNDGVNNWIIGNASGASNTLLNVSTFASGGIYTPTTEIRISSVTSRLNLGVLGGLITFKNFKFSNLDETTGTSFTYKIGVNDSNNPIFNQCFFNIGNVETNVLCFKIAFFSCSFTASALNCNNASTSKVRFFESVTHGLRTQNGIETIRLRNLLLIADSTSIDKLNLSLCNISILGYNCVYCDAVFSLIHIGISTYSLEQVLLHIENLSLYPVSGQVTLINYGTTIKQRLDVNITNLIGTYNTLSNLSDEELSNPESQRKVVINGKDVSMKYHIPLVFNTVAECNSLNSGYNFINCKETGKSYRYVAAGASYIVDNIEVLATLDGGDTRFVSVDYNKANVDGSNMSLQNYQDFNNKSSLDITSAIIYYVNSVTGSDSNDGLTVDTPFQTLLKAIKTISNRNFIQQVTIQLASGTYTIDSTTATKYLKQVIASNEFNSSLVISGSYTTLYSNVVITNITGRKDIRTFSGISVSDNALAGKFILHGGTLYPIGGNQSTFIFLTSSVPTGTYNVVDITTILDFTSKTLFRHSSLLRLMYQNCILTSSVATSFIPQQTIFLNSCRLDKSIAGGNFTHDTGLLLSNTCINACSLNGPNLRLNNSVLYNKASLNIHYAYSISSILVVNSNLGSIKTFVGDLSDSIAFINTGILNNNTNDPAVYISIRDVLKLRNVQTYGNVRLCNNNLTNWNIVGKSCTIVLTAYDNVNYPLNFVLPTLINTTEPAYDLTSGRMISIQGQTKNFQPVLTFDTIAEINTLGSLYDSVFCTETGKMYKYSTSGYAVDNNYVIAGTSGQFVSLDYFNKVKFDLTSNTSTSAGELAWNSTYSTLSLGLPDGGSFELGQEIGDNYHNLSGTTLVEGDIVASIGASGNRTAMTLANPKVKNLSMCAIGMVTVPSVTPNNVGRVTKIGKVHELNTNAYNEGDILYVDPQNPGKWTTTIPSVPDYVISIGTVLVKHATEGVVDLNLRTNCKLEDLSDVDGTPLIENGQIPVWDTRGYFDFTDNINNHPTMPQIGNISGDLTGFDPQYPVILTFNDANRTLTITPSGTNFFDVYYEGTRYRKQTDSIQITDEEGIHLIFYNSTGGLSLSHGPVDDFITKNMPICILWWDAVNKRHIRKASELHGVNRDRFLHRYIHLVLGTGYSDGLEVNNITIGDGSLDSHLYTSVSDGTIYDEDLKIPIINNSPQQLQNLNAPVFYLDGSDWRATTSSLVPFITGTNGLLSYNNVINGYGTQEICIDNTYMNYNLFATFDDEYPIVWVQGRRNYNSLSYATQNIHYVINELIQSSIPFAEFTPIGAITLKVNSSYTNTKKAAIVLNNDAEKYHDLRVNYKLNRYPEKIVNWNEKYIIIDFEQGKGDFTNLKDAVEWFNNFGTCNLEIKINPGVYYISDTINVNNSSYSLTIDGSGLEITNFKAATGLIGKPMITLNSTTNIGHISFDASSLLNYGTSINENAINVNCVGSTIFRYLSFYRFYDGMEINNINNKSWLTMANFNSCISNGVRYLNGSMEVAMAEFDNNASGVYVDSGTNSLVLITNSLFNVNTNQYGIKYDRNDTHYHLFSVTNNAFVGSGTYGYGFDYSNPLDADILVIANTGLIDNTPKAYIQFKNNATVTTCTTQNTFYKVAGTNTSSNTRKFTISDNKAIYQPSLSRNLTIFVTGNIATTTTNRTLSIGIYKNGNTLLEEMEIRTTTANQYFSFGVNTEVEIVNKDEFFEIWVSCTSAGGVDAIVRDMQFIIKS